MLTAAEAKIAEATAVAEPSQGADRQADRGMAEDRRALPLGAGNQGGHHRACRARQGRRTRARHPAGALSQLRNRLCRVPDRHRAGSASVITGGAAGLACRRHRHHRCRLHGARPVRTPRAASGVAESPVRRSGAGLTRRRVCAKTRGPTRPRVAYCVAAYHKPTSCGGVRLMRNWLAVMAVVILYAAPWEDIEGSV